MKKTLPKIRILTTTLSTVFSVALVVCIAAVLCVGLGACNDTVNLDRLCNFYGYEIKSDYGSTEDSRFGILYGYINAIDMTKYQKEVYHGAVCTGDGCEHHVDEQDGQVYDLVATWLSTLQKTDDGKYVLADCVDLAVAVAYLAYESGIQAPTPCGAYSSALPVISL